jgi:hypothetical protein
MEDEEGMVDQDVQEVRLEEADTPREYEDIGFPIDGFHLNKCEFVLNSTELSVQDVHIAYDPIPQHSTRHLYSIQSRVQPRQFVITRNSLIGPAIFAKLSISARIRLRTSVVRSRVAHRHRAHRQRRLRSIALFPAKGARYSQHSLYHFCPHFNNLENA